MRDGSRWRRTGLLLVVAGLALAPHTGAAQSSDWQVDVTGSRIQYDTLATLNAPSLSLLNEWRHPDLFGRLSGSVTGFENAGWSVQGRGDLAGFFSPLGSGSPFRLELAGTGAGSRHSSGFDSFLGQADLRLHLAWRRAGVWAGAGAAAARNSLDVSTVTAALPGAGLWVGSGPFRATASYLHTTISGESYPEGNVALSYTGPWLDLTGYGGFRHSPFEGEGLDDSWVGASASFWLESRVALVVSGGRYAPDLLQGLPGGEFFSVGLRITSGRRQPRLLETTLPLVYSRESAREGGIAFRVEGAAQVEIAGDWNGWQPVPLVRRGDGEWSVPSGLAPGVYRFNLLVDGERWMVPEGVPEIDDGFGGTVGLLIISES